MDIDIVYNKNCIEFLKRLEDNSIDAIITDPPYNLGFMGKKWDKTGVAFSSELWEGCLRVIKPGGNLLSFGGTRTYHRMVCAIEDVGFEVRDCIMYVYGSGFPKSLNIGKAIDKLQGNKRKHIATINKLHLSSLNTNEGWARPSHRNPDGTAKRTMDITKGTSEWEGYGTGLKPAYEPIVLAMAPLDGTFAENCLKWGVGGLNIDECRIPTDTVWYRDNTKGKAQMYEGWGMKPNIKEQNSQGRFPANFIHDGSQEVMELFPETNTHSSGKGGKYKAENPINFGGGHVEHYPSDTGSAARFFYCAKASKKERDAGLDGMEAQDKLRFGSGGRTQINGEWTETHSQRIPFKNTHPTVKPLALMEYLVKLITRPGHIVLDPFIGSGTTAMACVKLGRHYIGCEIDKGYCDIAIKRINETSIDLSKLYRGGD